MHERARALPCDRLFTFFAFGFTSARVTDTGFGEETSMSYTSTFACPHKPLFPLLCQLIDMMKISPIDLFDELPKELTDIKELRRGQIEILEKYYTGARAKT